MRENSDSAVTDPPEATLAPDPADTRNLRPNPPDPAFRFDTVTPRPGTLGLGHYDVLERLGNGGFGVVVKAFDRKLHREVAVKMMSAEAAATSPARKRFVREARAAAAVRHENVVQIYAVEEQPTPHLVMEFLPGGSLQQYLDKTGPLDVPTILRVGEQIARGLAAAHATGLVHRDIKPANILLDAGPEMRVKITDFGLARAADDASLTQSGAVAGTPMYMAPEQARGESLDHRADLFSLGSVLYVMACGRPPFRASNTLAVLKRVTDDTPRPVREIVPEVPDWLSDIIAKLHAKTPADRYQTAAAVADVLAKARAELAQFGGVPSLAAKPRRRWPLVVAGVVAVVAVGVLVFGLVQPPITPVRTVPGVVPVADPDRFTNAVGMEFARVPAGTGWLGGGGGMVGTKKVEFPADFYLGVYEVTQAEWERVMGPGTNPSRYARGGEKADEVADVADDELKRFPVDGVSWDRCQEFITRLSALAPEPGWAYRLPTAAEWEYACRGGPSAERVVFGFDYYIGEPANRLPAKMANYRTDGPKRTRTCAVGSYPANKLGLHDMHGNVFEWCLDPDGDEVPPLRRLRGGWAGDGYELLRAFRVTSGSADAGYDGGGLRVARVPVPRAD